MADAFLIRMAEKPLYERNFLPEITELSPEQLEVLRYPLSKDLLVSGPAGSGKTVLAIYRHNAYAEKEGELLTFTNMLKNYIAKHLNDQQITIEAKGIFEYVKDESGITVPPFAQNIDFEITADNATKWAIDRKNTLDFIIADEAQDFHNGHLGFISNYAERLTLFADDAQTLYDHGHSTIEIIGKMRLEYKKRKIERKDLTGNYRNQPTVAKFANAFYRNRNDEPLPSAILEGEPEEVRIFIGENEENLGINLFKQVKAYTNSMADQTPKIGILTQNFNVLTKVKEVFENNHYEVTSASNGIMENGENIFSAADPIIMSMVAAKGLEFDYVVIPYFDYDELERDRPNNYEQITFTAITRARRSVAIFIMNDQENFLKKLVILIINNIMFRSNYVDRTFNR